MMRLLFTPESPRPWALMRVLLAGALLWDAISRWPFAIELYSSAGFSFPAYPNEDLKPYPMEPLATVVLHSALVVLIGMLFVGWHSRLCAVLVCGLTAWFSLLDAAGTLTKYTVISLHLLLLMSFAQPGGAFSVDAWRRNRHGRGTPLVSTWPRWLLRVLVCSIYLGAAVTKIRLPDFATGDLLEFSLLDDAYGGGEWGLWLATKPKLLILASFATIGFELLFPVLVWVPRLRRVMLLCSVMFHLGLGVMMHLEIFSPVMFAALCVFLTEEDFAPFQKGMRKIWAVVPRRKQLSEFQQPRARWEIACFWNLGVFLLIACGLIAGLTWYQYREDVYGVFHRTVVIEFPAVETDQANEMIDAFEPEYRDYFHRIEIGSRIGYRHVYGERDTFQPGQVVYVMARLLQPHPSWDLEWELTAPQQAGEEQPSSDVYPRRLEASHSYASIGFQLKPKFPAGPYKIRLYVSERFGARELIKEIEFELVKDAD